MLKDRSREFVPAAELLSCTLQESNQRSASADGCPAELAARRRRCAHTAAGNQKGILVVRDACARTGGAMPLYICMLRHSAGSSRRPAAAALRDRTATRHLNFRGCLSAAPAARSELHGKALGRVALALPPLIGRNKRKRLARRGELPASAANTTPHLKNH